MPWICLLAFMARLSLDIGLHDLAAGIALVHFTSVKVMIACI